MNPLTYPLNKPDALVVVLHHKTLLKCLAYLQLVACALGLAAQDAGRRLAMDASGRVFRLEPNFLFDVGLWAGVPMLGFAIVGVFAVHKSTWPMLMTHLFMSALIAVLSFVVFVMFLHEVFGFLASWVRFATSAASCKLNLFF